MRFTPRISKAINTAALLHEKQVRKGDGLPFIVHPVAVALILMDYSSDEDVVVAGFLHDTIEDTSYDREDMEREFGPRVTRFVSDVTEPPKPLPWQTRKDGYLEHLKSACTESQLICAADKLHNLQSMFAAISELGTAAYKRFNAPLDKKLWFYEECLKIFRKNPSMPKKLTDDIEGMLTAINRLEEDLREKEELDRMAEEFVAGLNKSASESEKE